MAFRVLPKLNYNVAREMIKLLNRMKSLEKDAGNEPAIHGVEFLER